MLAKRNTNFMAFFGLIKQKTNRLPRILNNVPKNAAICPFSGIFDQKCQEVCVFLQWYQPISVHCFFYIGTRQLVSTNKICKKYMWKSVYLGRFQNLASNFAKITLHCKYLFVEMN